MPNDSATILHWAFLCSVKFRGTSGQTALSVFNTRNGLPQRERITSSPSQSASPLIAFFQCYRASDSKIIEIPCDFSYGLSDGRSGATLNEQFTKRDIAKFSELLKQLPEVNAERLAKESKAEQEQSLFKR